MTTIHSTATSKPQSLAKSLANVLLHGQSVGQPTDDESTMVTAMMRDVIRERASDAHIDPFGQGFRIRFRVDGELYQAINVSADDGAHLINQIKATTGLDPVAAFTPNRARRTFTVDGCELDLRVTTTPCLGGEKIAIRVFDAENIASRADQLGFSDYHLGLLKSWLDNIEGMCVVTGPTGSGKTTMLYAMLHELKLLNRNVITIEDPVEYDVPGITQIQVDQHHDLTFETGLSAMLRLDPDYLLVGEVRSADTARVAATAATTGLVLMTTLHSPDAVGAVVALRNWGLTGHEIADGLRIVVAERLVRKLCTHCREKSKPCDSESEWLQEQGVSVPSETWKPRGCHSCNQRGFSGRTGVFEMWRLGHNDLNLIRKHGDSADLYSNLSEQEHVFMIDDGLEKAAAGITTIAELQHNRVRAPLNARHPISTANEPLTLDDH